jgi:hypothetical protein
MIEICDFFRGFFKDQVSQQAKYGELACTFKE